MRNIVCVSAIANLAAHCMIAVYDNGSGKKLGSGTPDKIQNCQYAGAKVECITIGPGRIDLWLPHDEVLKFQKD